ncbi:hypothetical protein ACIBUY_38535 [Streptomyces sp. NPDC050085]|uniref:hypothetical protein n=1 Tax=Streptomyces sp. NPDC050085 TaxID=3365600 RepID=UPI0037AD62F7
MLAIRYLTGFTTAGLAVVALTLAGCSDNSSGGGKESTPDRASGGATLVAAKAEKVTGTVVTDREGYVLYRFDADSAKPTKVTCYGGCAKLWPAATAPSGGITVNGVDRKLVSTVQRTDGTKQLTLDGWPLYRYAKDDQPREAYGQGVGGTWFAVTPAGGKASGGAGGSGY